MHRQQLPPLKRSKKWLVGEWVPAQCRSPREDRPSNSQQLVPARSYDPVANSPVPASCKTSPRERVTGLRRARTRVRSVSGNAARMWLRCVIWSIGVINFQSKKQGSVPNKASIAGSPAHGQRPRNTRALPREFDRYTNERGASMRVSRVKKCIPRVCSALHRNNASDATACFAPQLPQAPKSDSGPYQNAQESSEKDSERLNRWDNEAGSTAPGRMFASAQPRKRLPSKLTTDDLSPHARIAQHQSSVYTMTTKAPT